MSNHKLIVDLAQEIIHQCVENAKLKNKATILDNLLSRLAEDDSCPFCVLMLNDTVKRLEETDNDKD